MSMGDVNRDLDNPILQNSKDLFQTQDITKVPDLLELNDNLQNFPVKEEEDDPYGIYVLRKGDTAAGLARRLKNVTWQDLLKINNLTETDATKLKPGREFLIPRGMGIKTREDMAPAINNEPLYTPGSTTPNYSVYGEYADEVRIANDENRIWFNEDVMRFQSLTERAEGLLEQNKMAGGHIDLSSPVSLDDSFILNLNETRNNLKGLTIRKQNAYDPSTRTFNSELWTSEDEKSLKEEMEKFKGHYDTYYDTLRKQPIVMKTLREAPKVKYSDMLKMIYGVQTNEFNRALHLQHQNKAPEYLTGDDVMLTYDFNGNLTPGSNYNAIMGMEISDDYDPWIHMMTYDMPEGMGLEMEKPYGMSRQVADRINVNDRYNPNPNYYRSDRPQLVDKDQLKKWFQAVLQQRDLHEGQVPGSGTEWLSRLFTTDSPDILRQKGWALPGILDADFNIFPNVYGAMGHKARTPEDEPFRGQESPAVEQTIGPGGQPLDIPDRTWVVDKDIDILDEPRAFYASRGDTTTGLRTGVSGFVDKDVEGVGYLYDQGRNEIDLVERYGRLGQDRGVIYIGEKVFLEGEPDWGGFGIEMVIPHELRHIAQEAWARMMYGKPTTPGQDQERIDKVPYLWTSWEVGAWLTHAISNYRMTKHLELGNNVLDPLDWQEFRKWHRPYSTDDPVNQFLDRVEQLDEDNNSTQGVDSIRYRISENTETPKGLPIRRTA
tara:strand:+ start:2676 stop:4826 length:2151 start_codon:yes stop_codon:yes gene_type:complete